MHAQLGHIVDQLGVKEALFLWLGLAGLGFKSVEVQLFRSFGVRGKGAERRNGETECY